MSVLTIAAYFVYSEMVNITEISGRVSLCAFVLGGCFGLFSALFICYNYTHTEKLVTECIVYD